jgi:hypothetical protein
MMREVVGGVTGFTLADPADPDEDFIKSSGTEALVVSTIASQTEVPCARPIGFLYS